MKAVILAGGKGIRLGPLTAAIPKPMVTVGGMPLLAHQIELLKKYGIDDITIITNYLPDVIESFFGDGSAYGLHISYFREQQPLGTTGGLKEIEHCLTDDFMVLYGDLMINMNLQQLIDFHRARASDCTLVVHPNDHPYDSDLVELDHEQRIVAFHPKPHAPDFHYRNLVNAAVYIMSPAVLTFLRKGVRADFGRDIFPELIHKARVYGYGTAEYIKDVGTPARLAEVTLDYSSGRIERCNRDHKRRAIFLDRDGVINEEVGLLHRIHDFRLLPAVGKAIRKINDSDYLAIVVTNQPVIARNLCTIDQLEDIHKKMETLLGRERAKLDAIYYCPHHPDRGYPEENPLYKIACACRKPGTGLIKQAEKDFNLDLGHSFIIGDSQRDIICGQNARITTIGVKTGKGCRDSTVAPDHLFETLDEAVDFIIQKNPNKSLRKPDQL